MSNPTTTRTPTTTTTIHPIFQYLQTQSQTNYSTNNNPFHTVKDKVDTFITHSLWFSPLIETCKSLLAFLPGRFSTSNLSGEAIYTILSLVGQYNDQVLGKSAYNPYGIRDLRDVHNNVQYPTDKRVKYINIGLHFFSIFEALLEQSSSHLFTHLHKSEHQSIQNGITERSNYLTSLLLQKSQIDPITNDVTFDPNPTNSHILTLDNQLKRFPHSFQGSQHYNTTTLPPNVINEDGSVGIDINTIEGQNHLSQLSPTAQLYFQPTFQGFLNTILSMDSVYRRFMTLDYNWMIRLFQFKMFACTIIELIKFTLRMTMLCINNGHMNLPKNHNDANFDTLHYKNIAEEKRYKRDQIELVEYTNNMKQWLLTNKAKMDKNNDVNDSLNDNNNNSHNKNNNTKQKDTTKPSAPALASSFSSNLTTTPFTTLKPAQNQTNDKKTTKKQQQQQQQTPFGFFDPLPSTTTTPTSTSSITSATNTLTSSHQQRVANQPIEKTIDLRMVKNLKMLYLQRHRGVISHGQFAFNLIQTYFNHYHWFSNQDQSVEEINTLNTVSPHNTFIDYVLSLYKIKPISPTAAKLDSIPYSRGLQKKLDAKKHQQQDQKAGDDKEDTTNTTNESTTSTPISRSIDDNDDDHVLELILDVTGPTSHNGNTDDTKNEKIVIKHDLADDEDGCIETVYDVNTKRERRVQEQLYQSAISNALKPQKSPKLSHIISEVLYWLRPVVYTLSSALCNQPALTRFVMESLIRIGNNDNNNNNTNPLPSTTTNEKSKSSSSWWTNLIISNDLSNPSILPTILSLIIDFFALYFSPAWDPQYTLQELFFKQQQERLQLLTMVPKSSLLADGIQHNNNNNNDIAKSTTTSIQQPPLESNLDKIHPITTIILQQQHQSQIELLQTQLSTWQQRKGNYWLYVFRPPFLTLFLLKPLTWLADKLANIPLLGGFLHFIIALLKIFQHHYFYASGS